MTGYVRVDTSNNIADGNVISAADLDNEFDGIQAAFNASTGHNHDGTTGEGAPILVLGPTQDVVVGSSTVTPKTTNTVDIGSSSLKFKDLFLAGNASIGGTLAVTGVATLTANPVMSGGTANGVAYLNGSKVLTTGSALTFDGSTFQSDTSGFRIGKSPADSPSANIYASVIADVNQTSELWIGANTASVVGGSFLSGLGFYNTDNTTPGANLSGIKAYIKDSTGSMYLNFYAGNTYYAANTPQYTIDPAYHAWFSGTTEGMRLTSTGLGIGTSSPAYRLDVVESADSEVSLRVSNQNTGANSIASLYLHGQGNNFFIRNYGDGTSNANKTDFISAAGSSYFTFSPANAERMRIDASGNLGLGVTPSAWGSSNKAVQLPGGAVWAFSTTQITLGQNVYDTGSGTFVYASTDAASRYRQLAGAHAWFNAPSGTAGASVTFTQAMTLDASGRLIRGAAVGVTSSGGDVTGIETLGGTTAASSIGQYAFATTNAAPFLEMGFSRNATVGSQTVVNSGDVVGAIRFSGSDGTNFVRAAQIVGVVDGTPGTNDMPGRLVFSTSADGSASPTERMRIDSAGNLGLGVTPSAWVNYNAVQIPGGAIAGTAASFRLEMIQNAYYSGSSYYYVATSAASVYRQSLGAHIWYNAPSGTAGAAATFTQAMTLFASGGFAIGSTTDPGAGNIRFESQKWTGIDTNARYVADDNSVGGALYTGGGFRFFTGGANERMRIDASGNLGLGTTSVDSKLRVLGATSGTGPASLRIGFNSTSVNYFDADTQYFRKGDNTNTVIIDSSSNVQTPAGAQVVWAPAPASISTTATLTNANIQGQIINTTGTSYTVTMPLGTTMETLVPWAAVNLGYNFTVINTASGTITMAVNTGVTSLGALTIATGTSAQFRIRRTAANTFILYRMS